jgi:exo-1,4-beta-D-glucosaminidase
MEPVHVQYSYDDNSVAVVNSMYMALNGRKVSAKIYNIDGTEKFSKDVTVDMPADSSTKAFDLPQVDGLSKTYFLRLQLHAPGGELLGDNFYWLSTKADTLNWEKQQDTVYTPQAEFGDLTGLNSLPPVKLQAESAIGDGEAHVTVTNPSNAVAFMVHLRVTRGRGGEDLTPIFWDDNYFTLLPGEKRTVSAKFAQPAADAPKPVLVLDGWNVASTTLGAPSN